MPKKKALNLIYTPEGLFAANRKTRRYLAKKHIPHTPVPMPCLQAYAKAPDGTTLYMLGENEFAPLYVCAVKRTKKKGESPDPLAG